MKAYFTAHGAQSTPPLFLRYHAPPVAERSLSATVSIPPDLRFAAEMRCPWDSAFASGEPSPRGYFY
jgi:hypothetical protein